MYIVLSFRASMHIVQFIIYLHSYINLIYIVVDLTINMLIGLKYPRLYIAN